MRGKDDEEEVKKMMMLKKEERIEELEEALRQSVRITAEREMALNEEEMRRTAIAQKVSKLEQRLMSLQTAHALRCATCRPLLNRLQSLEQRLSILLNERRTHLQDLARMKQEALESAISEKDAHLALLEVSGLRTARQAEQAEKLRADRDRLKKALRRESEQCARLIQEYAPPDGYYNSGRTTETCKQSGMEECISTAAASSSPSKIMHQPTDTPLVIVLDEDPGFCDTSPIENRIEQPVKARNDIAKEEDDTLEKNEEGTEGSQNGHYSSTCNDSSDDGKEDLV